MIISHNFLINKVARCIYPRNNEIHRFRKKKRQRLIGRFQPFRNYDQKGLSAITNLKKDLPINMMDDHKNSDRMMLFYKEKLEETIKRRKNPYQRDYFKFYKEFQAPYRLGYEENDKLLYSQFQNNWDQQKQFNLMVFHLDNYFADQSLLEITEPESFVGHFDAIVDTQRTLYTKYRRPKYTFNLNHSRYNRIGQSWLNEKIMRLTNFSRIGLTSVYPKVRFKGSNKFRYERVTKRGPFDHVFASRRLILSRRRGRVWHLRRSRRWRRRPRRIPVRNWRMTKRTNKPFLYKNKATRERIRFHSYYAYLRKGLPTNRFVARLTPIPYKNPFKHPWSLMATLNFATVPKMKRTLAFRNQIGDPFPNTKPPETGWIPWNERKPTPIPCPNLDDLATAIHWNKAFTVLSFGLVAAALRIMLATFGLNARLNFRSRIRKMYKLVDNLRIVSRHLAHGGNPVDLGDSVANSDWVTLSGYQKVISTWFNIDEHPLTPFLKKYGNHKIVEAGAINEFEIPKEEREKKAGIILKPKNKNEKEETVTISPENEIIGRDLYKMFMERSFTFYGSRVLPNFGSFIIQNHKYPSIKLFPLLILKNKYELPSKPLNFVKPGLGGRIHFLKFNKAGIFKNEWVHLIKRINESINFRKYKMPSTAKFADNRLDSSFQRYKDIYEFNRSTLSYTWEAFEYCLRFKTGHHDPDTYSPTELQRLLALEEAARLDPEWANMLTDERYFKKVRKMLLNWRAKRKLRKNRMLTAKYPYYQNIDQNKRYYQNKNRYNLNSAQNKEHYQNRNKNKWNLNFNQNKRKPNFSQNKNQKDYWKNKQNYSFNPKNNNKNYWNNKQNYQSRNKQNIKWNNQKGTQNYHYQSKKRNNKYNWKK